MPKNVPTHYILWDICPWTAIRNFHARVGPAATGSGGGSRSLFGADTM
ncbi:hypothetical protein NSERUTF1_6055 [Nocardia seriolae]|nr:hypothetical protein NSERUTF1_6055 [Nocardia seriolae]